MIGSNLTGINGNTAIFIVEDGNEKPIPEGQPVTHDEPLPRVRQVLVPVGSPPSAQPKPPAIATPTQPLSGQVPTLDEFLTRWRRGKSGLKPATEAKLDDYLKMTRRYLNTQRPVTEFKPQDIREAIAAARSDKVKGQRRLKGQTINEAIWRSLKDAFDLALEEKVIASNPMAFIDREKTTPINRHQHNWADAERVLDDVKDRAFESYLELKFMLLMGVGQGEAKDLRGGRVDWADKKIAFIRQKTGKLYTVPVYPWAENFIRKEIEPRLKPDKPVFDWRNPRKSLETSCRNLGVARVEIRSLRRTLIIHLIQQHVDLRLIARWQGHADARLILSRYGQFIDADHEKSELEKLCKASGPK
jgi:integrase